jgi:hypothetical protein
MPRAFNNNDRFAAGCFELCAQSHKQASNAAPSFFNTHWDIPRFRAASPLTTLPQRIGEQRESDDDAYDDTNILEPSPTLGAVRVRAPADAEIAVVVPPWRLPKVT